MHDRKNVFAQFARNVAKFAGKPYTFLIALALIMVWGVSGPIFKFSDTWQLVINTSTTIITFLMVFIIQNTQNRDTEAMQLKLDELIRISSGKNALLDLEELSDKELDEIQKQFVQMAQEARTESKPSRRRPKRKTG